MNDDNRLYKVEILIQQKKYAEADKFIKELLREDPNDIHILALHAEVNLQQDKLDNALSIIENAIGLSPDTPYLYYIKSRVAWLMDNRNEAEESIRQAIELNPYDAEYFAFLASIKLQQKRFQEALDNADAALEIDAENLLALNIRSTALNKLNRKEESIETIEGALREDPNNAFTHANYGWGLLEKGNHKKALEHFKEALSNDPTFEYAQAGILVALKATNPVYRIFMKYSFFMSNLTAKYQWAVIIGIYIGFRALSALAKNNQALQPYLTPLIIALALIAFSTWIISPLSNLILRFNKYGQLLLDKKEKLSSNLVAVSLSVFLVGLVLYFILSDEKMLTIAVFGFTMMLPLGTMFAPSKRKYALLIYTIALSIVGLLAIVIAFSTGMIFNIMSVAFIIGFIAFQWIANFILIREDNR